MIIKPPINLTTVDPERPLSDHPRNSGVVAAWLTLPHVFGGSKLYDLGGRYHGTLPGAGITRAPASRANGYGELAFDEPSQQSVPLPDMTAHFGAQEATIACWLRLRDASPSGIFSGGLFNFGPTGSSFQIAFPFSDGNIYVSTFDTGRPIEGVPKPPNLTSWNHLAISSAAGADNYKLYWNGELFTYATRNGFFMPAAPNLGKDYLDFFFDGWMDDVWLWSRAIGDAEVRDHYLDSLASYPEQLRRRPVYVGFAAGGDGGGGGSTAVRLKDATRNAILADVISAIGSTAVLCLFSGTPTGKTAGTFNADPSGLLVEVAMPSSPFTTPSAGVASLANGPWTGTATAGAATAPQSYRIKTATGGGVSTVVFEGPAGVELADPTTGVSVAEAITSGDAVTVSTCTLTAGNA